MKKLLHKLPLCLLFLGLLFCSSSIKAEGEAPVSISFGFHGITKDYTNLPFQVRLKDGMLKSSRYLRLTKTGEYPSVLERLFPLSPENPSVSGFIAYTGESKIPVKFSVLDKDKRVLYEKDVLPQKSPSGINILLLSKTPEDAENLMVLPIGNPAITIQSLGLRPEKAPADEPSFALFDAVLLESSALDNLSTASLDALRAYVREGGYLVFLIDQENPSLASIRDLMPGISYGSFHKDPAFPLPGFDELIPLSVRPVSAPQGRPLLRNGEANYAIYLRLESGQTVVCGFSFHGLYAALNRDPILMSRLMSTLILPEYLNLSTVSSAGEEAENELLASYALDLRKNYQDLSLVLPMIILSVGFVIFLYCLRRQRQKGRVWNLYRILSVLALVYFLGAYVYGFLFLTHKPDAASYLVKRSFQNTTVSKEIISLRMPNKSKYTFRLPEKVYPTGIFTRYLRDLGSFHKEEFSYRDGTLCTKGNAPLKSSLLKLNYPDVKEASFVQGEVVYMNAKPGGKIHVNLEDDSSVFIMLPTGIFAFENMTRGSHTVSLTQTVFHPLIHTTSGSSPTLFRRFLPASLRHHSYLLSNLFDNYVLPDATEALVVTLREEKNSVLHYHGAPLPGIRTVVGLAPVRIQNSNSKEIYTPFLFPVDSKAYKTLPRMLFDTEVDLLYPVRQDFMAESLSYTYLPMEEGQSYPKAGKIWLYNNQTFHYDLWPENSSIFTGESFHKRYVDADSSIRIRFTPPGGVEKNGFYRIPVLSLLEGRIRAKN